MGAFGILFLEDGNIEYLGRTDNQVKIHGYRIELEEIETYINQFDGIKQSIVIALEKSESEKILEAFYTSEDNIESRDISNYLSTKLPSYMVPSIYKQVQEFIQTANGKIDRKKVTECIEIKNSDTEFQFAIYDKLTDIQAKIFKVILSNLNKDFLVSMSLDTYFSNVALDSLSFIKMVVDLESTFNFEFDDEMLSIVQFPTIWTMIKYVESKI